MESEVKFDELVHWVHRYPCRNGRENLEEN